MISIREHCIPAYDEISRMNSVEQMPEHLDQMEQETAGGIVKKVKAIIDSDYFKALPTSKIIKSGGNFDYEWKKSEALKECQRFWNECSPFLG